MRNTVVFGKPALHALRTSFQRWRQMPSGLAVWHQVQIAGVDSSFLQPEQSASESLADIARTRLPAQAPACLCDKAGSEFQNI